MATFTIGNAEDQARNILLDTDSDSYRFTNKEIYLAMHEALKRINNVRPESRYVDGVMTDLNFSMPDAYDSTTLSTYRATDVNMEDRWLECVVFYIVYRMYLKDDADTQNAQLAANYLTMFNNGLAV